MKTIIYLFAIVSAGLIFGCSSSQPPAELINAREAYQKALSGPAAQLVPAEVHKAQIALATAEKSFQDEPKSIRTRDLAYVADRKAKMAEALGATVAGNAAAAKADKEFQLTQAEVVKKTKEELAAAQRSGEVTADQLAAAQLSGAVTAEQLAIAERSGKLTADQLAAEKKAREAADKRTADAQAALLKLAAVKEEARGLVITLSGSILFASNKSVLLGSAKHRLNQVAEVLMATKGRKLVVEGHTDSQGTNEYNEGLSQKRAEAVRSYFISRGYPGDLIQASGIGEDRPVAENSNAEGRANNRRVEIIVDQSGLMGTTK